MDTVAEASENVRLRREAHQRQLREKAEGMNGDHDR
jgi:hypothetical protein